MIFYSYMPHTDKIQEGLLCSFSTIDNRGMKLSVSPGNITIGEQKFTLNEEYDGYLPIPRGIPVNFSIFLVKSIETSAIDIVVTYFNETSRDCVFIYNYGYESIALLGQGNLKVDNPDPDSVEFTEYIWI